MKRKFPLCLLGLISILYTGKGYAQELLAKESRLLAQVPFIQLTGGVVILKACLDNHKDSLNFILDTGSGGISLDSATLADYQLPLSKSDKTIRGIAGIRPVLYAKNHSLKMRGITVDSLDFHVNDYELLSAVYGIKIDGIIGYSFLRRYIVTIDYERLVMGVYEPGYLRYPRGSYILRPTITGLPVQTAWLEEQRDYQCRFYFDTGAGLCLLLNQDFVSDSSLFTSKKRKYNTMAEGLGGKKEMELTVTKSFKLGPYKFRKVPTYIFEDEYNVTSYPSLAGLIGNDLLRRFNLIINYGRSQICITPNAHFRDAFDYSYTGLGLYMYDNKITIADIHKGSPAEKAGLQAGDELIAVQNNMSRNMQEYKNLLQVAGATISMIVSRDGQIIQTKLKVGNIRK